MRLKSRYAAAGSIVVCVIALVAFFHWHPSRSFDATVKEALSNVANTHSYVEDVQTEDHLTGETLYVNGTYLLDESNDQFASYSTTTLVSGNGKPVVFTLDNISIGPDIYTKVEGVSPGAKLSVPSSPLWHHFNANAVPQAFQNIATTGAVLDNLKLLSNNGAYLSLVKDQGVEQLGGATLSRYTFRLTDNAMGVDDGTLGALVARIGESGVIDIWIDESTGMVKYMHFENASYASTTTLSRINDQLTITAPDGTE